MKRVIIAGAAALLGVAAPAYAQVVDGSFETQGAASPGSYCYFLGNYAGACGGGAWTGGGQTSGLQNEGNSPWPGAPSPAGSFYAFIQSGYGAPGSITQSLTLGAGTYKLNWLDAGRPGSRGDQAYDVFLGSNLIGGGATTSGQPFTSRTTGQFTVATAGTYNLTFQARDSGSDNAAFLDAVQLSAVPEPASWALMIGGFGLVGSAMRRRPAKRMLFA